MPDPRNGSETTNALLEVRNLKKHYPVGRMFRRRFLHAVDGIDFVIAPGETFALVGESGSGKSTAARAILRLEEPTSGEVVVDGQSVTAANEDELRRLRARMQMVFQDPYDSLNPRMRCGEQVAEPAWLSGQMPRGEAVAKAADLLHRFHLPENVERRYPHQLSGGQLQRVGIARALMTQPALLILDEPTSALDVSVQAQIINLLRDLQSSSSLAYLFISHDLHVVGYLADRLAVMYLGQIVEQGPTDTIFEQPAHPYTRALISAIPVDHPLETRDRITLSGEPASPIDPAPRCRLVTRCPYAAPQCIAGEIPLVPVAQDHLVRCVRFAEENVNGHWEPEPTGWVPPPVARP
jgi:oligopeptide/dipeptide ABC transporter ATP-binding protein